jgi:hypothetical protein
MPIVIIMGLAGAALFGYRLGKAKGRLEQQMPIPKSFRWPGKGVQPPPPEVWNQVFNQPVGRA